MKILNFLEDKFIKEKGRQPNRHELIDMNDKEKVLQMLFDSITDLDSRLKKLEKK